MTGLLNLSAGSLNAMEGLSLDRAVLIGAKPPGHAVAGERTRMTGVDILAMVAEAMADDES